MHEELDPGKYVSNVTVKIIMKEDLDPLFFSDFQFLTSYTIRVYPEEERCGGTTNVLYKFQNIDAVRN